MIEVNCTLFKIISIQILLANGIRPLKKMRVISVPFLQAPKDVQEGGKDLHETCGLQTDKMVR